MDCLLDFVILRVGSVKRRDAVELSVKYEALWCAGSHSEKHLPAASGLGRLYLGHALKGDRGSLRAAVDLGGQRLDTRTG